MWAKIWDMVRHHGRNTTFLGWEGWSQTPHRPLTRVLEQNLTDVARLSGRDQAFRAIKVYYARSTVLQGWQADGLRTSHVLLVSAIPSKNRPGPPCG